MQQEGDSTAEILCRLIRQQLQIADEGAVTVYFQQNRIPPDEKLRVAVGVLDNRVIGNVRRHDVATDAQGEFLQATQGMLVLESIEIQIFSASFEAYRRYHEIPMALFSDESQRVQEQYGLQIGRNPTSGPINASRQEGPAFVTHWVFTYNVTRAYNQSIRTEYFNQFTNPPKTLIVDP